MFQVSREKYSPHEHYSIVFAYTQIKLREQTSTERHFGGFNGNLGFLQNSPNPPT